MKKALAVCLAFCIVLSVLIPMGIAVKAETQMSQAETILYEDFETATLADSIYDENGNYNTNNDIGGFNGWQDGTKNKNPLKPYDTNRVVNVAKIVDEGENKAGSFIYTKAGSESNDNLQYYIKKSTLKAVSTGIVVVKMRVKPTAQAGMLLVNLSGAAAQASPYITFWLDKKRMAGDIVSTANGSLTTMQENMWTDYEIHINFDSRTAKIYAGEEEIKNTKTALPSSLTQITSVSIGLHRTQGAWAAGHGWLVDNIEVVAIPRSDAVIVPTDELLTNKAKLIFNNEPESLSTENISIKAESGVVRASAVEAVSGDGKSFVVTFPKNLTPQTDYTVILDGITDKYGGSLTNKEITYTTPATGNIYYVSPNGNDKNAGTKAAPWKTAYHAAKKAAAGDTVIFEDGIYRETEYTVVENNGTAGKPITFKAQNPHKAIIFYGENCRTRQKFRIHDKQYINIRDLYFTQESTSLYEDGATLETAATSDIFINVIRSSYCEVTGNKIVKAFEEGIKGYCSNSITIANNEIYDMNHEGIDLFAVINPDVCANKVINFGRDAFMIKGNSANCRIYNNYAHNDKMVTTGTAFDIGGSSDGTSPICTKENIGFENHNSIFYNNVVYAIDIDGTPSIGAGFSFLGAKDCHCYNNTVAGTRYGIRFQVPTDSDWQWWPNSVNPTIKNNILANIQYTYSDNSGDIKPNPENVIRDYNLFYNCSFNSEYKATDEPNSIVLSSSDDLFAAYGTDFRIKLNSKAKGVGTALADTYPGFIGYAEEDRTSPNGSYYKDFEYDPNRVIDVKIDLIDYNGNERTAWDIGAYAAGDCIKEIYASQYDTVSGLPEGYSWEYSTQYTGEQIITGTDANGSQAKCLLKVGTNGVYVAEDIKYKKAYDTAVLANGIDGKTTVLLKMTDQSTKEFAVNYDLNANKSGVYKVLGTIDGFSEKIPVIVTVAAEEENKILETYKDARVILEDGTWVDTSKLGCQYHDVITSKALVHYAVYVGEFSEKFACTMDYPEGMLTGNYGSASEGDYYLSVGSSFINSENVQIEKDGESSVLKIGPQKLDYGVKAVFNNTENTTVQKASFKIKMKNITEHFAETGTINSIPYHVAVKGADGNYLSELYFRLYFSTNGFEKLTVGPHLRGGTYPNKEKELKNEDGSSIVTFTQTDGEGSARFGETDWITISVTENADQTYDVFLNDKLVISAQTYYLNSNNVVMSRLPIKEIDFRKRLPATDPGNVKNDSTAYMHIDDITLYQYSRIAEDLKAAPDVAVPVGSDAALKTVYLKMTDGTIKGFDAEISALDTSKVKSQIISGRIDGVNQLLDLKAVVCNYVVDSLSFSESADKLSAAARIRKLTDKGNATAIIAIYNNENVMQSCQSVSLSQMQINEAKDISVLLDVSDGYDENGSYAIVYIWEYDKIQPIDIANRFEF